jgi:hypothetical protein
LLYTLRTREDQSRSCCGSNWRARVRGSTRALRCRKRAQWQRKADVGFVAAEILRRQWIKNKSIKYLFNPIICQNTWEKYLINVIICQSWIKYLCQNFVRNQITKLFNDTTKLNKCFFWQLDLFFYSEKSGIKIKLLKLLN